MIYTGNNVDVIVQRYVDYTGNNKIKLNGKEIIWQGKQHQIKAQILN